MRCTGWLLVLAVCAHAGAPSFADHQLARSDPVWAWKSGGWIPSQWSDGPFAGNGMLGIYLYGLTGSRASLEVGRADVWDVRLPGSRLNVDKSYLDEPRLGVGTLTLSFGSAIAAGRSRIHLANATVSMTFELTDGSQCQVAAYVHATRPLVALNLDGGLSAGSPCAANLSFVPHKAASARGETPPKNWVPNPDPSCTPAKSTDSEVSGLCIQSLPAGPKTGWSTAWQGRGGGRTVLLTVANAAPAGRSGNSTSSQLAEAQLSAGLALGDQALGAEHCSYWERFWGRSMLSVSDGVFEAFHYIQLYKVGSATRCDGPENCWAYDLAGPWYVASSRWPDYHWDLNVQMAHWLVLASNHADLGRSLGAMVGRNMENLIASVPEQYQNDSAALAANTGFDMKATCDGFLLKNCTVEPPGVQLGDLAWVCHNLWWQYRYETNATEANTLLRTVLVPTLKRSIGYYLRLLTVGADGKLHLPEAESPEYATATDTNYDLGLLTWGLRTLQLISRSLASVSGLQEDPRWQHVLDKLAPYPTDNATGLLIGHGVQLAHGHRHWSHLFSIFPLMNLDPTDPLAIQSLDHFAEMNGAARPEPLISNGFPRVAFSAMSAMLPGRADAAYGNLSNWFKSAANGNWFNLGLSTQYWEASHAPCNESPLGAAFAIQFMMLQSWQRSAPDRPFSAIRVFPSMPSGWSNASFASLVAEGGFKVSAVRTSHRTDWLAIVAPSEVNQSVFLWTDIVNPVSSVPIKPAPKLGSGWWELGVLGLGATVVVHRTGHDPGSQLVVQPVAWPKDPAFGGDTSNWWGLATDLDGPCDITGRAGNPCVAAHSTVRALYAAYDGPLYNVTRGDGTWTTVGVLSPGGFANISEHDEFCSRGDCLISHVFDQSPMKNHLGKRNGHRLVNASKHQIIVGDGVPVYGMWFDPGFGYHVDKTRGVPTGNDPESIYAVMSGKHYNGLCCFDYGNSETDDKDDGCGTMEAIYFGNAHWHGNSGAGIIGGPWVGADLEQGMYYGGGNYTWHNPQSKPLPHEFVSLYLRGGTDGMALKGGDATQGELTTMYSGPRPDPDLKRLDCGKASGYQPMRKQGAIILATGGDNSNFARGNFYEGMMVTGVTTDATDNAVQANIVAVGYKNIH